MLKYIQIILCFTFLSIFLYFGLKNIGYPLIWNDESETLMTAESILLNGYPKVHTNNNILYMPDEQTWIGYKKSIDANIAIPWFTYYFATIPVTLSHLSYDFYTRNILVRTPFFLLGFIGLLFLLYSVKAYFSSSIFNYVFVFFMFFESLSISLILNMREARYYSIVVFLGGVIVFFVNRYLLQNKKLGFVSLPLLILILFICFQTQYVFFASVIISLSIFTILLFLFKNSKSISLTFFAKENFKPNLIKLLIVIVSLSIMITPFVFFYDMIEIAAAAKKFYNPTSDSAKMHISKIIDFLLKEDFLILAIFSKVVFLGAYLSQKPASRINVKHIDNIFFSSLFVLIFMIVLIFMCSRMPFLFVRHFIFLQPLLAIGMALDVFGFVHFVNNTSKSKFAIISIGIIFFMIFCFSFTSKMPTIKGHFAEMNKQVKGPLDYIIPAIKEKYGDNTKNIVIATNYEELTYLFYLNCRVILGYNYKNLESDLKETPDVLVYRKNWGHAVEPFNSYFQKAKYERVAFEVFDSRVNNITEMNWFFENHKFKTKFAINENEKADVYYLVK